MTVARLARENLRYYLVATVMKTARVSKKDHRKYNLSCPIINGKLPISGAQMIDLWPCNHLGFTFGDFLPHLVEMAKRTDIGYVVFNEAGRKYTKIS